MKIIQIITSDDTFYTQSGSPFARQIYGLGEDSKLYYWDYYTESWKLLEKKPPLIK